MKEDIDLLGSQELQFEDDPDSLIYPDLPMCVVTILATKDASHDFNYQVQVEGIIENRQVNIQRVKKMDNPQGVLRTNIIINSLNFNPKSNPSLANFQTLPYNDIQITYLLVPISKRIWDV